MARGRRNNGAEESGNTGAWMMTFSDLIMLLLTFFVLLLTMSSMDKKKLKDLFTNFSGSTGVLEFSGYGKIKDLVKLVNEYHSTDGMLVINQELLRDIILPEEEKKRLAQKVEGELKVIISDDSRGIILTFQEEILFDPGQVMPKASVLPILDRIAMAIKTTPNDILIMGHSDSSPINTSRGIETNWKLSAYRALAVLNYFIKTHHISSTRFAVGGYGPSKPLEVGDSPAAMAKNRRVEIIFRHI
jgi:chemotaxis protein MotB